MENQTYTRCYCGSVVLSNNLTRHLLSKLHPNILEINQTISADKTNQENELMKELYVEMMKTPTPTSTWYRLYR